MMAEETDIEEMVTIFGGTFTKEQCREALLKCNGDMERAVDTILNTQESNVDTIISQEQDCARQAQLQHQAEHRQQQERKTQHHQHVTNPEPEAQPLATHAQRPKFTGLGPLPNDFLVLNASDAENSVQTQSTTARQPTPQIDDPDEFDELATKVGELKDATVAAANSMYGFLKDKTSAAANAVMKELNSNPANSSQVNEPTINANNTEYVYEPATPPQHKPQPPTSQMPQSASPLVTNRRTTNTHTIDDEVDDDLLNF
eukprot:CFRG1369T1